MGINGIFNGTFSLLEKNMDLRIKKHQMIVSNIANIDTPNYKAFDIAVQEAFGRDKSNDNCVALDISNPQHFNEKERVPGEKAFQGTVDLKASYVKEEKNNDIDNAMMKLGENSIVYNATAQILSKKYNLLKQTINERG
jgi:flagellar basal-body rod protein FlgB